MAFVTASQAQAAARRAVTSRGQNVSTILRESRDTARTSFDIFLSHSRMDQELVLGAKQLLEEAGFTVYVDWIDDPTMDRSSVSRQTAEQIRIRMKQSNRLFYLHTRNAALSKWCPWELGYFDAKSQPHKGVFVFPIVDKEGDSFVGQEYLALYDVVDLNNIPGAIPSQRRASIDPASLAYLTRRTGGYIF